MHLQSQGSDRATYGLKFQGCTLWRCECKEYQDDFATAVERAREVLANDNQTQNLPLHSNLPKEDDA